MKTLIAVLLATAVASPVLAQEGDRTGNPNPIGVTTPAPRLTLHPSVSDAYAWSGKAAVTTNNVTTNNVDPDPFIRSQLPRDAYSN